MTSPEIEAFLESAIYWIVIVTTVVLVPLSVFVGIPVFLIWLMRRSAPRRTSRDFALMPVNDTWVYVPLNERNRGTRRSGQRRGQTQTSRKAQRSNASRHPANRNHRSTGHARRLPRPLDYWDETS